MMNDRAGGRVAHPAILPTTNNLEAGAPSGPILAGWVS